MGFNLVRLHHHDSFWVSPNIFGKSKNTQNTFKLNSQSLDKVDWWIKSLKDEGIYIWLDLHVQRFLLERDGIYAFDEIEKKSNKYKKGRKKIKGANLKGFNYVNSTIKNAMKSFNHSYVNHVNPYTKVAYKDEPAIIAMLITNENDLTFHYGNSMLPNKNVPMHNSLYNREVSAFAEANGLPKRKVGQSWKFGPSKLFLNDLEYRFNVEMIQDLRDLGVKVPIATTNTWGKNPLVSLPALTAGDIIDVHSYGKILELEKNPLTAPTMTAWMAAAQVASKPVSVTEWNVGRFPIYDRHTSPLIIASKASHQGWDAMMQYAYAQYSLDKIGGPSSWHSHNDPSFLSSMPAAALLYRRGHVKEASTTYYLAPAKNLFNSPISPATSVAIRTASEKGKLLIGMPKVESLPWLIPSLQPEGSILISDFKKSYIPSTAVSVTSDTGELKRNWELGIYQIDTERSQAVAGWIGGKTINLSSSEFQIDTPNATVVIQSLNENPINESQNVLISLSTNALPYRDIKNRKKLPFYTQPLRGTLKISAPAGMQLSHFNKSGEKTITPVVYKDQKYIINLDNLPQTHWLSLQAKGK